MDKIRALNNRTITIEDDERERLSALVSRNFTGSIDSIICADLFSVIDSIPDEIADLIIIDPPYNLDKDFNGNKFRAMSNAEYIEYLHTWFHKVCRKLKPDGSMYVCGDWRCTATLQLVMEEELHLLNRITWQREKGRGAKNNWKNGMEDIWFGVKDKNSYYFDIEAVKMKRRVLAPYRVDGVAKDWTENEAGRCRLTCPSNFWDDISVPFWTMPENTDHPTQKPAKLYAKLILASTQEGDVVFDPFAGSGTAAVVAAKLGRHYLGVEINEEYCLLAAKRLLLAQSNKSIQGYSDGVFWERNSAPRTD